jgi:hypothetical protein
MLQPLGSGGLIEITVRQQAAIGGLPTGNMQGGNEGGVFGLGRHEGELWHYDVSAGKPRAYQAVTCRRMTPCNR